MFVYDEFDSVLKIPFIYESIQQTSYDKPLFSVLCTQLSEHKQEISLLQPICFRLYTPIFLLLLDGNTLFCLSICTDKKSAYAKYYHVNLFIHLYLISLAVLFYLSVCVYLCLVSLSYCIISRRLLSFILCWLARYIVPLTYFLHVMGIPQKVCNCPFEYKTPVHFFTFFVSYQAVIAIISTRFK